MHLKYNIFVILDNKFTILRVPPAWICRVVTNNHSKPKFQCSNLPEKMLHLAAVSNEFPDQLLKAVQFIPVQDLHKRAAFAQNDAP